MGMLFNLLTTEYTHSSILEQPPTLLGVKIWEENVDTNVKPGKPPAGYKLNPLLIETKSRRLQLLLQPSLYRRIKRGADAEGKSVNEFIHSLLDEALPNE